MRRRHRKATTAKGMGRERMNAIGLSAAGLANVIPISERSQSYEWQRVVRDIADRAFENAGRYDADGASPLADIAALQESGLLSAVLPREFGGDGLAGPELCNPLRAIGSGSLPLGRLFEGHVNALGLVIRYGRSEQLALV